MMLAGARIGFNTGWAFRLAARGAGRRASAASAIFSRA